MIKRLRNRWLPLAAVSMAVMLVVVACGGGADATATPRADAPADLDSGPGSLAGELARLASSLASSSDAQQSGIWVDGSGSVTAVPDVAILSFGIEARADTVAPARAAAAVAMDAVIASMRSNGVADRDIKTTSFRIQPITVRRDGGSRLDGDPIIVGYRVTNLAIAKVRNIDAIGPVIDDAVVAGGDAIRINSISFTVDDPKPLEVQARALALEDAMEKARLIAGIAGVTLGRPTLITQQGGAPRTLGLERAPLAAADFGAPTPISAGEMEVTVRVQMVFAIQ